VDKGQSKSIAQLLGTAAALVMAGTTHAAIMLVPIANAGFEDLTGTDPVHFDSSGKLRDGHLSTVNATGLGPNAYQTSDPIPGWFISPGQSGEAGTYNPTVADYPNGIPGGQNVAWSRGPLILQGLGPASVVQANMYYTLVVHVGNRATTTYKGYDVHVRVNGLDALLYDIAPALKDATPTPGTFDTVVLSGFVGNDPNLVGRPIQLWLAPKEGSTDFDNIEFYVSDTEPGPIVPEPAGLASLGLVGLASLARRRRR
jgi:hypothetical protein